MTLSDNECIISHLKQDGASLPTSERQDVDSSSVLTEADQLGSTNHLPDPQEGIITKSRKPDSLSILDEESKEAESSIQRVGESEYSSWNDHDVDVNNMIEVEETPLRNSNRDKDYPIIMGRFSIQSVKIRRRNK